MTKLTTEQKLALYGQVVAMMPTIKLTEGEQPFLSIGGQKISYIDSDGDVTLRLPEKAITDFIEAYNAHQPKDNGQSVKEYVVIPDQLLNNPIQLLTPFQVSYKYVSSLKSDSENS